MCALDSLVISASWVVQTSLKASAVVILLLLVRGLLRNMLPAKWLYALWLLLIIRLCIPFEVTSKISIFNAVPAAHREESRVHAPSYIDRTAGITQVMEAVIYSEAPQPLQSEIDRREVSISTSHLLALLWLSGTLALVGLMIMQYLKSLNMVRSAREMKSGEVIDIFNACRAKLKIAAPIKCHELDTITMPLLYGLLRPRLLLPQGITGRCSREGVQHIVLHELAHFKRCDILISAMTALLQAVHWFNPLIWYGFSCMRLDRELACDEMALSHLPPKSSQRYGNTIIRLLKKSSPGYALPLAAGVLETKNGLKRRLKMIARFKPVTRWVTVPAAALLLILGGLALTDAQELSGPKVGSEKRYAAELTIYIGNTDSVKVENRNVSIDSLSHLLSDYFFDENSLISLVPATGASLNTYIRVQQDLQAIAVQKIKYLNSQTGFSLITPQYDFQKADYHHVVVGADGLRPVRVGDKYCYKNNDNEVVVEPRFDMAWYFEEGFAGVNIDERWGFINDIGELVIPLRFRRIRPFSDGLAAVMADDKWGFIDKAGAFVIEPIYESVSSFREGLAPVQINGKTVFINKKGAAVIENSFQKAWDFSEGLAPVQISGKWGYVDTQGNIVIRCMYDEVDYFSEGLARVKSGGRWGYIDRTGQEVIEQQFTDAASFSEGLAAIKISDHYGFVDVTGRIAIEPQFDYVLMGFQYGVAQAINFEKPERNIKSQSFTFDKAGNLLTPNR